ncbi:Crp/Fnr family transcriptional regulator [Thermoanaerobacteraceae bacterium SP2]|nr:Crp/Fnr family transcriptional regulator [Thermoanaerobacteraceae bacterium SP2]
MQLQEYGFVNKMIIDDLPWIADCDFSFVKKMPGAKKECFFRGNIIIHQGTQNKNIYYIDKGRVRFSVFNIDGEEKTIAIMTEGNIFGEESAWDGLPCPTSVIAITDVTLYRISGFDGFLDNPGYIREMVTNFVRKNRVLVSEIASVQFKDAYTRLATCIFKLSKKYGVKNKSSGNIIVLVHFTHEQMAALMGTSRVTITNILNKMRKERIIDYDGGLLVITDERKLMKIVEDNNTIA